MDMDDLTEEMGAPEDDSGARARAAGLKAKKRKGKPPAKNIPKDYRRPPKPPNARHLEELRQIRLRYQIVDIPPEELPEWNLCAAPIIFTRPVIFPPLASWEAAWDALQQKQMQYTFRKNFPYKKGPEEPLQLPPGIIGPADRETEADKSGDRHTFNRRLDQYRFLVVKRDREPHTWGFPITVRAEGEMMRKAAARAAAEFFGKGLKIHFDTPAPCAHIFYRYPEGEQIKRGKKGAMLFFYKALYLDGEPKLNKSKGLLDYAWVARDELQSLLHPSLWKAIEDAVHPILGADEYPDTPLPTPPAPAKKPAGEKKAKSEKGDKKKEKAEGEKKQDEQKAEEGKAASEKTEKIEGEKSASPEAAA